MGIWAVLQPATRGYQAVLASVPRSSQVIDINIQSIGINRLHNSIPMLLVNETKLLWIAERDLKSSTQTCLKWLLFHNPNKVQHKFCQYKVFTIISLEAFGSRDVSCCVVKQSWPFFSPHFKSSRFFLPARLQTFSTAVIMEKIWWHLGRPNSQQSRCAGPTVLH